MCLFKALIIPPKKHIFPCQGMEVLRKSVECCPSRKMPTKKKKEKNLIYLCTPLTQYSLIITKLSIGHSTCIFPMTCWNGNFKRKRNSTSSTKKKNSFPLKIWFFIIFCFILYFHILPLRNIVWSLLKFSIGHLTLNTSIGAPL